MAGEGAGFVADTRQILDAQSLFCQDGFYEIIGS